MTCINSYSSNITSKILEDVMNELSSTSKMTTAETNVQYINQIKPSDVDASDNFLSSVSMISVKHSDRDLTHKNVNSSESLILSGMCNNDIVLTESYRDLSHKLMEKIMKNVVNYFESSYVSNSLNSYQFVCSNHIEDPIQVEATLIHSDKSNHFTGNQYFLAASPNYYKDKTTDTVEDVSKLPLLTNTNYYHVLESENIQSDMLCHQLFEYATEAAFRIMDDVFTQLSVLKFSSSQQTRTSLNFPDTQYEQVLHCQLKDDLNEVILSDTFMYGILTNSESKRKGKFLKPKSKKLKKQERSKKKLIKELEKHEVQTFEDMGFWTSNDIFYDEDNIHRCPVCFELYYNPYFCMPCKHSFCEPCLRRLAKYNCDNTRDNTCPICREPISYCRPNQALISQISTLFPTEYVRRQKADGFNKYMRHPLPSKTTVVSLKHIARVVNERNRTRPPNRHRNIRESDAPQLHWRLIVFLILCLICKACIVVGIIWIYHYFSKEEKITTVNGVLNYMIDHVWHYRDLNDEAQAKVSNLFVVITLVLVLFVFLVKVSNQRFGFVQRR